jgi:lysophospholipase L1-like esterase
MKFKGKYLALGDSYTIGEGVDYEETWPYQLKLKLNSIGVQVENPEIIAKTGWTTAELLEAIAEANPTNDNNLVSLLIGVNNQYRGQSIEVYKQEFSILIKKAINFANDEVNHVFVVSIPDWGVTPFAKDRNQVTIAQEIDEYNLINKEIAQGLGVAYFDVTAISRELGNQVNYLVEDNLHYSNKMYALWAEMIFSGLNKSILK